MRMPTKYCDLVMKGGITSGLVYPSAVLELATVYRFKNIGGTSAGAIAAAMSAAAVLGERRLAQGDGPADAPGMGMDGLAGVAGDLSRPGFIYGLFQPAPFARAAYRLIVRLAAGPSIAATIREIGLALLRLAPLTMLLTLVPLLAIGYLAAGAGGMLAALLPALFCMLAAGAWRALWVTARAAGDNFMGLCSGLGGDGAERPALTEWMHDGIRALAGLDDAERRPVTFGDLWQAPAYDDEPAGSRRIDLAIITTNISHSEPRTLPFAKGGFFFREDEFRRLFPAPVVDWMVACAPRRREEDGQVYHHLPEAAQMPIVVAARMSLSFPLLISAIPLHELDVGKAGAAASPAEAAPAARRSERPRFAESVDALAAADQIEGEASGAPTLPLRRCWFTDGGVSSNFPIHLFDAPLPRWPTFAIDLIYSGKQPMPDAIFLPTHNNAAMRPRYQAITGKGPLSDLSGFFFGIIGTMQNWRDLLQGRASGHRDRIVRVALDADEGGMNLNMPEQVLTAIAAKGRAAGARLIADFDFDNHFWIRYRNAASAAERFTISFGDALAPPVNGDNARAFERMWSRDLPTAGPYRFSKAQAEEAVTRLERIRHEAALWKDAAVDLTEGAPKPLPQLRVVPTF